MTFLIFCIVALLDFSGSALGSKWSHASPQNWMKSFTTCGQERQSPVDIIDNLNPFTPKYVINFNNYGVMEASLRNTGHSYQADIHSPPNPSGRPATPISVFAPKIAGGDLPGSYILAQLHFHWGSTSARGAEHTLNCCTPAGEMHFVHFKNKRYGSLSAALNHTDGLAVLAVWLTPGPRPNQEKESRTDSAEGYFKGNLSSGYTVEDHQAASWDWFRKITPEEGLAPVHNSHSDEESQESQEDNGAMQLYLRQLLPFHTSEFFRYVVSHLVPLCISSMVTLKISLIYINTRLYHALRTLRYDSDSETVMVDNYRPVQRLGSRDILYSGNVSSYPSPCSEHCGDSLPRLEVKQEQTCWASHSQYGVNIGMESSRLEQAAPLTWSRENNCTTAGLVNDGSALKVVYSEQSPSWILNGGGLNGPYQLSHVDVIGGSRHSLNGLEYPMEVQLVLFNKQHHTLHNALQRSDGLLVISRFFETPVDLQSVEGQKDSMNKILTDVIDNAPSSPKKKYWSILSPDIPSLISNMSVYYQYHGSDGTCNHDVIWMIMHNAGMVSRSQLDTLNKLFNMVSNVNKEIMKLDSSKLTLRVNNEELYNSYKAYMVVPTTETVTTTGTGVRFYGNENMCLYIVGVLLTNFSYIFVL
ncbi:unnamed protein product, partial [Meganyctiphanes norvegica]